MLRDIDEILTRSELSTLNWFRSTNHRRHMSESQRGMAAAEMANAARGRPELNSSIEPFINTTEAAKLFNVSEARSCKLPEHSRTDEKAAKATGSHRLCHRGISLIGAGLSRSGQLFPRPIGEPCVEDSLRVAGGRVNRVLPGRYEGLQLYGRAAYYG